MTMISSFCFSDGGTTPSYRGADFLGIVAAGDEDGDAVVVTLRGAVVELWKKEPRGAALKAALQEVCDRTAGQPYRLDTPIGPLFARGALRAAAGQGLFCSTHASDRPSWNGDWRDAATETGRLKLWNLEMAKDARAKVQAA
jgi:hypothetical protein